MQLCSGLNWRILDLGSWKPISKSLQVSRALAANGHKKPVVKALRPACWVVMSFFHSKCFEKEILVWKESKKKKKITLKFLFVVLC